MRQSEALRKMLLAVVSDVRLVLVRDCRTAAPLAAGEVSFRGSAAASPWHLKRAKSMPRSRAGSAYGSSNGNSRTSRFATPNPIPTPTSRGALKEKRVEREAFIEEVKTLLSRELLAAGVSAQVTGRPEAHLQHLAKNEAQGPGAGESSSTFVRCGFSSDNVKDCYAALGVVHNLWPYHPGRVRRLHRQPEGQRLSLIAYGRDRYRKARHSKSRFVRTKCTSRRSSVSRLTGDTRKAAAHRRRSTRRYASCGNCSNPAGDGSDLAGPDSG